MGSPVNPTQLALAEGRSIASRPSPAFMIQGRTVACRVRAVHLHADLMIALRVSSHPAGPSRAACSYYCLVAGSVVSCVRA